MNEWSPPIRSSYGEHVVWVHEREPAQIPPLSRVRGAVVSAVYRDREAELLRETVAELRSEFVVEIAQPQN